jgi:hypothetical protein
MPPRNAIAFEVSDRGDPAIMKPGAYCFMRQYNNPSQKTGVIHACPCGCGAQSVMWFTGGSMNGTGGNPDKEWSVKGEWPRVTLAPSIGIGRDRTSGKYHWHGYLRDGVFVEE